MNACCLYYVRDCPHADPPQARYIVLVCFDELIPQAFFVEGGTPDLLQSRAPLLQEQNKLPHNDFFVDCTRLHAYGADRFEDKRARLSDETVDAICAAAALAPSLSHHQKYLIQRTAYHYKANR